MRVHIFVDGQNTWHSLKRLDQNLTEGSINWRACFQHYCDGSIDKIMWFRPAAIDELTLTRKKIGRMLVLDRYVGYRRDELLALNQDSKLPHEIYQEIEYDFQERLIWLKQVRRNFNYVNSKYIRFKVDYPEITICRCGVLKVDPYAKKLLGEKGIDVAIACRITESIVGDMCDKIILVSGDADYEEAIKIAKSYSKKIECIKIGDTMSHKIESLCDKTHYFNLDSVSKFTV